MNSVYNSRTIDRLNLQISGINTMIRFFQQLEPCLIFHACSSTLIFNIHVFLCTHSTHPKTISINAVYTSFSIHIDMRRMYKVIRGRNRSAPHCIAYQSRTCMHARWSSVYMFRRVFRGIDALSVARAILSRRLKRRTRGIDIKEYMYGCSTLLLSTLERCSANMEYQS